MSTTVLVVEDDLEINELLGEYLSLENIKYLQATTGNAGIYQAASTHPDAMILDLMLPDINGFEVARSLTMKRATFDIPIVILSCMCQECDKQRGFASGALYYMNKPFLPDDLLSTLRMALDWKNSLKTRKPEGTITLGEKETVCARGINEMIADIFVQTELSDSAVGQIREAVETLAEWAVQWNKENRSQTVVKLEYRIVRSADGNGMNGTGRTIEWTISESAPGMLADAFFKPVAQASGTGVGGGLLGWGAGSLLARPIAPIAPPSKWLQVLAKAGAAKFEKESKTNTVRFSRNGGAAVSSAEAVVPVVEIDGNRVPTRLRDEALAAKRK
ncbi:MAG TPA: response regulator [Phycisphaerae bacterium]|nr:response regulator [Phycisphaerae bacterium]